jgi:hypothetical protein
MLMAEIQELADYPTRIESQQSGVDISSTIIDIYNYYMAARKPTEATVLFHALAGHTRLDFTERHSSRGSQVGSL